MQNKEGFKKAYADKFAVMFTKPLAAGTLREQYLALAGLVRDEISRMWLANKEDGIKEKEVYYFSIEFLPGRFLLKNLLYLGLEETVARGLEELGLSLEELALQEKDPGLGSGGLGRLAASFLDSLATLKYRGHGMGLRYSYGLFEQKIIDGAQAELPDDWLKHGFPLEFCREDQAVEVKFGGYVRLANLGGRMVFLQEGYSQVQAVPYDVPILGYRNNTVNVLRLWQARSNEWRLDFPALRAGRYCQARQAKDEDEAISQVLYPDDSTFEGKQLRLKQQYFLASAGLQSILGRLKKSGYTAEQLPEKVALHINDTHPALLIPELMRILLDEEGLSWNKAWDITNRTVAYTNHTILPEALEKWGIELFRRLLPRIYMIIEEINKRFCGDLLNKYPQNPEKVRKMAVIADGQVKMPNLAVVGSHKVNGVSGIHSRILREQVMNSLHEYYPGKFNGITNGVTQRRWILMANPSLAALLKETVGESWISKPEDLVKLAGFSRDSSFCSRLAAIRQKNKERLASFVLEKYGLLLDPQSIFDTHIKRIHAYKRQLLNVLHIIYLYKRLRQNPDLDIIPRTFFFAGKAAPTYSLAKNIIRLIYALAHRVNNDPGIKGKIRVVFLENYSVSLAELVIPASDVSEQLSTAGKEASGTGNMKFMMNGAVTVGTMDGANIEIKEAVGEENFIYFGLNAQEVLRLCRDEGYNARKVYNRDSRVREACEQLRNNFFGDNGRFAGLYEYLLDYDEFFVLEDLPSYIEAQKRVNELYGNREKWLEMCTMNIAHSGYFSSDRSIREYAAGVWHLHQPEYRGAEPCLN